MTGDLVPVSATWRLPEVMPYPGGQMSTSSRPTTVEPPSLAPDLPLWPWSADEEPDAASREAYAAACEGRALLVLDAGNVSFPTRARLLLDHDPSRAAGVWTTFSREGDTFTCAGFAEPEHLPALLERPQFSPGLRVTTCRLEEQYGVPVCIAAAEFREGSAVRVGALPGSLLLGAPRRLTTAEQFSLSPLADTLRLTGETRNLRAEAGDDPLTLSAA